MSSNPHVSKSVTAAKSVTGTKSATAAKSLTGTKSASAAKSLTMATDKRSKSVMNTAMSRNLSRAKMRKSSYGFGSVPGVRPHEKSSQVAIEFKRPPLIYLPTYQLNPERFFNRQEVLKVVENTLDEIWDGYKYNPTESPILAIRLSGEVMKKVKAMGFPRYRIISIVTIGQKRAQSYCNSIAFIMDCERDTYCETHRENISAFIQVIVFGVYFD